MQRELEFEKRYSGLDLSAYFRFLDACRGTEKSLDTQEHHICPRAQFPELEHEPENLITLCIEDHVQAHRLLAALHPDFKRKAPEAWVNAARDGARVCKEKGVGIYASGAQAKAGRSGGAITGRMHKQNSTGIFSRTAEEHLRDCRKGGAAGGKAKSDAKTKACSANGKSSAHKRYHVARGITSASCTLCKEESCAG